MSVVDLLYSILCEVVNFMKVLAAGNLSENICSELENRGFEIFKTVKNEKILPQLAYHADMQVARFGNYAVCEPTLFDTYFEFIKASGIVPICGNSILSSTYPGDVAYNISEVGEYIFHNTDFTDDEIKRLFNGNFLNIKQGYSGCSICRIGENAIITSDVSVKKAAESVKIDCLLITPGNIVLAGFDYGFIGGASFFCGETVYFFGNAENHPDFKNIENFCKKHNTEICLLGDDELTDYGSLIILN